MNKQAVVLGVDPAPSKGLCVYEYDFSSPEETRLFCYGKDELDKFKNKVNASASDGRSVFIFWDAPLTMPRFYKRGIEKVFAQKHEKPKEHRASVQPAASCSHWAISQYVLGFPSCGNRRRDQSLIDCRLIFDFLEGEAGKVYLVEVYPALAMQCILDSPQREGKQRYHLSGKQSYKNAKKKDQSGDFTNLAKAIGCFFGEKSPDFKIAKSNCSSPQKLNPSDYLDAWVAMKLGIEFLTGTGKVKIYGDEKIGSFLLPKLLAAEEAEISTRISGQHLEH